VSRIDVTGELGHALGRRSHIESLCTRQRATLSPGRALNIHAAAEHYDRVRQESEDIDVIFRKFRKAVGLPLHAAHDSPQAMASAMALGRKRAMVGAADTVEALLGMGGPQHTLDLGQCDAVVEIRGAAREFAEASGTMVTHGACSPRALDWVVRNAVVRGHCSPHHPTPHVSGTALLPGGTGITMVTDASFPDDKMVFFNPRDALFLCEGRRSMEVQWDGDRREIVGQDMYEIVAVKRNQITGARTYIAFAVRMPSGLPPGPPCSVHTPACGSGARALACRGIEKLVCKMGGQALSQYAREHGFEMASQAVQWVAERAGGAVAAQA